MSDKRKNNGGHSTKGFAGRKPKSDELKLISKLDNIINSDDAIIELKNLIKDGNFNAIKLYLEYRFGKPKETIENINHNFENKLTEDEAEVLKKVVMDKY